MSYDQRTMPVLTNDPNGAFEDQTTSGAADLTLDGDLVSGGVATAAAAQIFVIEGSGDNTGIDFTVTGTDPNGQTHSQTIDGVNNAKAKTTVFFATVTGVSTDGAITGNVEGGWEAADGMVTAAYVVNWRQSPFNMDFIFELTAGTMTLSAQYTADAPDPTLKNGAAYTNTYSDDANWRDVDGLADVIADDQSNLAFPVMAVRWIQTIGSATGTATVTNIQGQNG